MTAFAALWLRAAAAEGPEAPAGEAGALADEAAARADRPLPTEATIAQRIRELEWERGSALLLTTQIAGGGTELRAAGARALGRLRSPEALETLVGLRDDPDREVRVAAAEALAWTPGSAPSVREWLAAAPRASTPAGRAADERGVAVALLEALGQATEGDPADIELLRATLREPWPYGAAAARALGRAGQRGIGGLEPAVPDLIARLDAVDPRMAADAAWALSRIGIRQAGEGEIEALLRRIRTGSYETTRAWLVKAGWAVLTTEARDALFVDGATDPSRLVRVAVLGALRPDDVEPDVIATWLADSDPWIRFAAIDALGRIGTDDAEGWLRSHLDRTADPYEQAAVIRWFRTPDPEAARDRSLDPVVRAAHVAGLGDREALVAIATDPEELPVVRTAAAGALLDDPDVPGEVGERLLASRDPAVREAGLDLVVRLEPAARVRALGVHLRVETDPEVLASGLDLLATALRAEPRAAGEVGDGGAIVARAGARREPRVRAGAARVAEALGIAAPAAEGAATGDAEHELVLPGGEVVAVERGAPAVAVAARIRGARVETTEGTFLLALDPEVAPYAVANFARLAEAGWYDGLVFHRVVPGFVVQTGCPRGDGWGGPGYTLPDEVSAEPFDEGALGMARAGRDTGGSQWFVTTGPAPHLAGDYTRFGEVVAGMHVVKRLRPGSRILRITIERVSR